MKLDRHIHVTLCFCGENSTSYHGRQDQFSLTQLLVYAPVTKLNPSLIQINIQETYHITTMLPSTKETNILSILDATSFNSIPGALKTSIN